MSSTMIAAMFILAGAVSFVRTESISTDRKNTEAHSFTCSTGETLTIKKNNKIDIVDTPAHAPSASTLIIDISRKRTFELAGACAADMTLISTSAVSTSRGEAFSLSTDEVKRSDERFYTYEQRLELTGGVKPDQAVKGSRYVFTVTPADGHSFLVSTVAGQYQTLNLMVQDRISGRMKSLRPILTCRCRIKDFGFTPAPGHRNGGLSVLLAKGGKTFALFVPGRLPSLSEIDH